MTSRAIFMLVLMASSSITQIPIAMSAPTAKDTTKSQSDVVMYTTKTCGYCIQARNWFTSQGVRWDERDIEASAEARKEWQARGGMGTPLILINGKSFAGFDPSQLSIELAKYKD